MSGAREKCSLCGVSMDAKSSHNAAPYGGRCCGACNATRVGPARIQQLILQKHINKQGKQ